MTIKRHFQDIPEGKVTDATQYAFFEHLWLRGSLDWSDLLSSARVLIVSEAGAGKTFECRQKRDQLWTAGEAAFFLELATLAKSDMRSMLDADEEARLDVWLKSQSDLATFFLDSIDELKLSLGSFEQALKRLSKAITGQLGRARIVITTRPVPFDEQLVRRLLPVPLVPVTEAHEEAFARVATKGRVDSPKPGNDDGSPEWRTVALLPLSDAQIAEFARDQGVADPENLFADLQRRNAEEFARRPQDLIELCADWRDFKRIRTHHEQVASNVRIKLKPREDREEPAQLSLEKATEGAARLALAMVGTRRLTIRHSAEAETGGDDAALDPALILSDWPADERKALLERPLFGFATYGRVRFHHRSVMEYLAAQRVMALRARGMSTTALRRLIFAETKGKTIVRPSKRPIAGWLSLHDSMIFEMLRDHEPAVLLTEGDPESLTVSQRTQALRKYVERYGKGGWRGLTVPAIQVHRFASADLADEIKRLWSEGIENPEVRHTLINLVEAGRISECADIVLATAMDVSASQVDRILAVDALIAVNDPCLCALSVSVERDAALWPDELTRNVVVRLFESALPISRLIKILTRVEKSTHVEKKKKVVGDISWQLPRTIATAELTCEQLCELRNGLHKLVISGLRWDQANWPHIVADRPHLVSALAATCLRGLGCGPTEKWLYSIALAVRLSHGDFANEEAPKQLKETVASLSAEDTEALFWADDALLQSIHTFSDAWNRYAEIVFHGPVRLDANRDDPWIQRGLADSGRSKMDREVLLQSALQVGPRPGDWREYLESLRVLVSDDPDLTAIVNNRLKPSENDKAVRRWKREDERRNRQRRRREAKDRASWVTFWREVANRPDEAFSAERSSHTAWNLWRAMAQAGDESRDSGWNRRFIEGMFGKEIADRLRVTLMAIWRNDRPTLSSERPEGEKDTYLVKWQLGLAALYAESEDPEWAVKLSPDEAKLAARYAPIELNGLPLWMEGLAQAHPTAVREILGSEIAQALAGEAGREWHSMLLQSIRNSSDAVARPFIPILMQWLEKDGDRIGHNQEPTGSARRLKQVVDVVLEHGEDATRERVGEIAEQRLQEHLSAAMADVWIPVLMRLNADAGINALEKRVLAVEPSSNSEAVRIFSNLFGDRHSGLSLEGAQFTPDLLLRLLRLCYHHVRPIDDVKHDGVHSMGQRDYAERTRNAIVGALFKEGGERGLNVKLEMAADPTFAHFKDRILAVAEEQWAEEIDSNAFNDAQAVALDQTGEAPPTTNESMFQIIVDRLHEVDDLLLRDFSPREAWAGISEERIMRREIARVIHERANGLYKVDQEAVTGDEKETDIRLRSTASDIEGTIELKLADGRTAQDLRDTVQNQLVRKYMAAGNARAGALVITLGKDRKWDHPDRNGRIGFEEVIALVSEEAMQVEDRLGGTHRIHVHAFDLRPRLATEASSRMKAS